MLICLSKWNKTIVHDIVWYKDIFMISHRSSQHNWTTNININRHCEALQEWESQIYSQWSPSTSTFWKLSAKGHQSNIGSMGNFLAILTLRTWKKHIWQKKSWRLISSKLLYPKWRIDLNVCHFPYFGILQNWVDIHEMCQASCITEPDKWLSAKVSL